MKLRFKKVQSVFEFWAKIFLRALSRAIHSALVAQTLGVDNQFKPYVTVSYIVASAGTE